MKSFIYAILPMLVAVALAGGCEKSSVSCTYVITPHITRTTIETVDGEEVAVSTRMLATGVKAHAYYADTTEWEVASFDDAKMGIITNRTDPTRTMQPEFSGTQDADGTISLEPATSLRLMLVICYGDDPEKIFGWRNALTAPNIESISVIVNADPYQEGQYENSQWALINTIPSVKPTVAPPVVPSP